MPRNERSRSSRSIQGQRGSSRSVQGQRSRQGRGGQTRGARYSLQDREYRGADGQIHHHTHVFMERQRGSSRGGGISRSSRNLERGSGRSNQGARGRRGGGSRPR